MSDYFTSLHGVMKFEKEPSACEEVRRSIKPSAFEEKIADRRQTVSSFQFFPVIFISSFVSRHNLWPIHVIIEAVSTRNYKLRVSSEARHFC